MKLILIHGNAPVALGNTLTRLKKDFDPLGTVEIDSKDKDFADARLEIASPSLFVAQRLVILKDFKLSSEDLTLLDGSDLTLCLVFSKPLLSSSDLLKFVQNKKGQVISLDESKEESVFPFLNFLISKDEKAFLELDKLWQTYSSQYLLTMIFYSLRRLIMPPKTASEFVKKTLAKQQQQWPIEKIKNFYQKTLETDFKIKSGLTDEKLAIHLLIEDFLET